MFLQPHIVFTPKQIAYVNTIGYGRNNAKSDKIRPNDSGYHSHTDDRAYPHVLGVAAEIAYSQLTGLPFNTRLLSGGDSSDFPALEIKASTWKGDDIELKIKVSEYERKYPACYLLARVDEQARWVEFVGCVSRERFAREKYKKVHKFVANYCLLGSALKKAIPIIRDNTICFNIFTIHSDGQFIIQVTDPIQLQGEIS